MINTSFTKFFPRKLTEIKGRGDKNYRLPRARGGRGLTKVFTKFCSNHEIFTTNLCHKNLELSRVLNVISGNLEVSIVFPMGANQQMGSDHLIRAKPEI